MYYEIYRITINSNHLCSLLIEYHRSFKNCKRNKTGVINDPLCQTHSLASSEHCSRLNFVLFLKVGTDGRMYERTTCAKAMITTGRDCGSASWINIAI